MNIWRPATEAQKLALDCPADMLLFGGSAGSLKSHWLLLDAMQEWEHPRLRALITRDSFPNLTDLIDKSMRLYKPKGGEFNEQKKTWTFPAGGQIRFGYMGADRDVYNFWGFEYSFQGHDESTFQTEHRVRTLTSRLRATDPTLKQRIRLASNPGNIGASWHQSIFLRGACPVHEPDKCAVPGQIYNDRVWPSDGTPIPFSVAFIPGRLTDHNLLGERYAENLKSLSGNLADQLLAGCWCKLEGAYFAKVWDRAKCVVPYPKIQEQWWWAHWISLDYGVGSSVAAAGLFTRTPPIGEAFPRGVALKVGEISLPGVSAEEFAVEVGKRFVEPTLDGNPRNIGRVYLDPANFNTNYDIRSGVAGHAVADQINDVLRKYDLQCTPASNDRIGGAQLLYRELSGGTFGVADTCPMTAESIRTRLHDPKRPGDVLKVAGDPLDDTYDETRYGIYSFEQDSEKPAELRVKERLKDLDATSAMIRYPDIAHQEGLTQNDQPISMGRRGSNLLRKR